MQTIIHISGRGDFARAFDVSRETLDRLALYESLLIRWQKAVNLVAPGTLGDIWHRHIADSAQLWSVVAQDLSDSPQKAVDWLDLGSGAGFPGLVIAIMAADHAALKMHLVESNGRKCAFLADVARQTGVPVEIYNCRIESFELQQCLNTVSILSARALAPLPRLLELTAPFFSSESQAVFPKGKDADDEIRAAKGHWRFDVKEVPSMTDRQGVVLRIRHLQPK